MSVTNVIIAVVVVQIMGIIGALIMTKQAERRGAYRVVLVALVLWTIVVIAGFFVPAHMFTAFVAMAAAIGLVVAGTQALSRSLFSQLIPRGREAEYFSLYQAAERGTSWLGTLVFGLVHQFTDSYRLALIALLIFFVIGGFLLRRVDMRRGITDAGNELPLVI